MVNNKKYCAHHTLINAKEDVKKYIFVNLAQETVGVGLPWYQLKKKTFKN